LAAISLNILALIQHEDHLQGLDAPSPALIKHLDLAKKVLEGRGSAMTN
jgi:hypothetical protein